MNRFRFISHIIVFLISFSLNSFAQQKSTDTDRAFIFKEIKKIHSTNFYRQMDTATVFALLQKSDEIGYSEGKVYLIYFKSIYLLKQQKFAEAIPILDSLLSLQGIIGLDTMKPYMLISASEAEIGRDNYFMSLKYLNILSGMDKLPQKVKFAYYVQSAFIWDILPANYQPEGTRKALKFCLLAEDIIKEGNNYYNIGTAMNNTGEMYTKLGVWDSAENKIRQALTMGKEHDFPVVVQRAYCNLSNIYYQQHDYKMALHYTVAGLNVVQDKDPRQYTDLKVQLAQLYLTTKKYPKLKVVLEELERNIQPENTSWMIQLLDLKSQYYTAIEDYKQGLENYKRMVGLKDSVAGVKFMQEAQYLDYKYKIAEKDKSIFESNLNLEKQKNMLKKQRIWIIESISITIILLLMVSGIYLVQSNKRKLEAKKNEIENMYAFLEGEHHERERISMDLHDSLGGLISSIRLKYDLAMMEQFSDQEVVHKIKTLIADAANSVREISHNLNPSELVYSDLITAVEDYCDTIRESTGLKINVHTSSNLNINQLTSVELLAIIKELAYNIIKHAVASEAHINITQNKSSIKIIVTDNGIGFDYANQKAWGNGLLNLKNRVAKLNGTVSIKSKPQKGTTIRIVLAA